MEPRRVKRARGLSPRVRGSRGAGLLRAARHGSIPAGAGEPSAASSGRAPGRVYPRGCGGAMTVPHAVTSEAGLSPRVRGSRLARTAPDVNSGSIPAGAGEPRGASRSRLISGVYPRGCGGAAVGIRYAMTRGGLSPRVWGSLRPIERGGDRAGSIPAGAGEPTGGHTRRSHSRVYPRGCGGAAASAATSASDRGLSPRVRGSLGQAGGCDGGSGSIPAGAGEPVKDRHGNNRRGVYPRGCGGARFHAWRDGVLQGLSPRVRGSPSAP